ncbi:MAG: formylglycine-generating enzyme family protein, partial [Bacteroidales bacterium]|nr:formylglycine-generating enzyme family protein [Bacteroidales bacterium]
MKKMNARGRWLLGLSLTLCWLVPAGLRAAGADTARWTWTVEAGETKTFGFSGAEGALYVLQWGDGQTTYVTATGGQDIVTHAYAQAGAYDGLLRDENTVEVLEASMVYVEGGTFRMGATAEQGSGFDNQKPVHEVELNDFYMGAFEVTQAQWEAVMGTTVSQQRDRAGASQPLYGVGDNYPMYYVSWNEAVAFCEKLSEMTGETYRLPTEAEWE